MIKLQDCKQDTYRHVMTKNQHLYQNNNGFETRCSGTNKSIKCLSKNNMEKILQTKRYEWNHCKFY